MRLSPTQQETLAYWWTMGQHHTAGYNAGELHENKGTLDALHRLGLVERPHHAVVTPWCAALTDKGREVAEKCAEELGLLEEDT